METKGAEIGGRKVKEPDMYVGVTKTCPVCGCTNVQFKYLNNKNMQQPRYKCLGCNKFFTHNPTSKRKSGFTRKKLGGPDPAVVCLNPNCKAVGRSRFLYYNNNSRAQPRYRCGSCKKTFTLGGRFVAERRSDHGRMENRNRKVKLSSQQRECDEDLEIDEEDMTQSDDVDIPWHMTVEKNQDSDSDSDDGVPSRVVDTLELFTSCKSLLRQFCKTLHSSELVKYRCEIAVDT